MNTKNYILYVLSVVCVMFVFTSCSDFFDPKTDDEFDASAGYTSNTEMYTGFLGIMTKVQAIGDKEILLTETRGELIEPSDESLSELISLYQYDPNLQENSYANPDGYYEVIIACNDYLNAMTNYRSNPNVNEEIVAPIGELNEENTFVLVTVTVPKKIEDFSVNLKAPIVVNMDNRKAVQLIVEDDYPVKYKVYEVLKAKKEKAGE